MDSNGDWFLEKMDDYEKAEYEAKLYSLVNHSTDDFDTNSELINAAPRDLRTNPYKASSLIELELPVEKLYQKKTPTRLNKVSGIIDHAERIMQYNNENNLMSKKIIFGSDLDVSDKIIISLPPATANKQTEIFNSFSFNLERQHLYKPIIPTFSDVKEHKSTDFFIGFPLSAVSKPIKEIAQIQTAQMLNLPIDPAVLPLVGDIAEPITKSQLKKKKTRRSKRLILPDETPVKSNLEKRNKYKTILHLTADETRVKPNKKKTYPTNIPPQVQAPTFCDDIVLVDVKAKHISGAAGSRISEVITIDESDDDVIELVDIVTGDTLDHESDSNSIITLPSPPIVPPVIFSVEDSSDDEPVQISRPAVDAVVDVQENSFDFLDSEHCDADSSATTQALLLNNLISTCEPVDRTLYENVFQGDNAFTEALASSSSTEQSKSFIKINNSQKSMKSSSRLSNSIVNPPQVSIPPANVQVDNVSSSTVAQISPTIQVPQLTVNNIINYMIALNKKDQKLDHLFKVPPSKKRKAKERMNPSKATGSASPVSVTVSTTSTVSATSTVSTPSILSVAVMPSIAVIAQPIIVNEDIFVVHSGTKVPDSIDDILQVIDGSVDKAEGTMKKRKHTDGREEAGPSTDNIFPVKKLKPSRSEKKRRRKKLLNQLPNNPPNPDGIVYTKILGEEFVSAENVTKHPKTWTKAMKRFYNASWGGEKFDTETLQRAMSGNPRLWRMNDSDVYPLRMPRRAKCHFCLSTFHKSYLCPKPKPLLCCMCGELGHRHFNCPKAICLKCGMPSRSFIKSCNQCHTNLNQPCASCVYLHSPTEKCRTYNETSPVAKTYDNVAHRKPFHRMPWNKSNRRRAAGNFQNESYNGYSQSYKW